MFLGYPTGTQENQLNYNGSMASTDTVRIISSLQSRQILYSAFVSGLASDIAELGRKSKVRLVSVSQAIKEDDEIIGMNCTDGNRTFDLPSAASTGVYDTATTTSRRYTIKKNDGSANTLTLAATGSETIDGSSTYVFPGSNRGTVAVVSDGANWIVVT